MNHLRLITISFLALTFVSSAFAGDREDVQTAVDKTIDAFNRHDFPAYFSAFASDNTEFPYVVSPLRHDASAWKAFIEGTAALEVVRYHQQDNLIQTYNGNAAVVTGYYTFTWKPKGEELKTQSGRASLVLAKLNGKWLTVHMHFSKMF